MPEKVSWYTDIAFKDAVTHFLVCWALGKKLSVLAFSLELPLR